MDLGYEKIADAKTRAEAYEGKKHASRDDIALLWAKDEDRGGAVPVCHSDLRVGGAAVCGGGDV